MKVKGEVTKVLCLLAAASLTASCAGSPLGSQVERSLEADPQLQESSQSESDDNDLEDPVSSAEDSADSTASAAETDATDETDAADESTATQSESAIRVPEAGEEDFVGPVWSDNSGQDTSEGVNEAEGSDPEEDFTGIPADLQTYIRDLQKLDVLTLSSPAIQEAEGSGEANQDEAEPIEATETSPFAQPISRREYAQWLFESYNVFYGDEPGDRLRAGSSSDQPAFQDVSSSDLDFAAIQGLAEAGIIPSAFTGNSTAVNFRPDAPLVREDAILWKVPLDTRAVLPATTPETVTELWGFQDTTSIDPVALRAIAADFQLGDFSNFSRAFGYTTLFRPDKAVSRAEAAAILWRFGNSTEGLNAAEIDP